MAVASEVLPISCDILVRLDNLTDSSTEAYINDATVAFVVKDADGATLVSSTSMSYVSGSNGRYEGTIPDTTSLTENAFYTVEITATKSTNTLFRKITCIAKYRDLLA